MEPPDESTDRELAQACLAGDQRAFDLLLARHWSRLYRLARSLGCTKEDAEDLVQDAFVSLYRALDRVARTAVSGPWDDLVPYLVRVIRNLAIDRWRRRSREPSMVGLDMCLELAAAAPEDASAEVELRHSDLGSFLAAVLRGVLARLEDVRLARCIEMLRPREQAYVLLCEEHGLGSLQHQEIAAFLGVSGAAVTGISKRALRKLRVCLEQP